MRYIVLIFTMVFFLLGCANKTQVQTIPKENVSIKSSLKNIKLDIKNRTDEPIYIKYDIKKALTQKGYTFDTTKEAILCEVSIVYANVIDKKSSIGDIMKDINVNIGLGTHSGNVSLYTSIGATLGRLLGNNLNSTFYQTVLDVLIKEPTKKPIHTQWIITASMDGLEKRAVIYAIEEQIVQRTSALFE